MTWKGLLFLMLGAAMIPSVAPGAPPQTFNYQGVLLNPATGAPRPSGSYTVDFRIWNSAAGTDPSGLLWEESRSVTVDNRGRFNVLLGENTPIAPTIFSSGSAWLELTLNGQTLSPRRQIASVPYALQSENADALQGEPASNFVLKSTLQQAVSVTEFGATGNGTTDDTQAIRNALASLASGGGTLRFPPGHYLVTSTIEITQNNVSLVGDNRDACVFVPSTNAITVLRVLADGLRIQGLGFQGLSGSTSAAAIDVASGQRGFIWDCDSTNFAYGLEMHGDPTASPPLTVSQWDVGRCNWATAGVAAVYLHHCSDIRMSETWINLNPIGNIYGVLIDSQAQGIYLGRINTTGGSPLLVRDLLTPSGKPTDIYLNQFLADSSYVFGMQFEAAQNVTLVDCWAAGCKTGPGIVVGNKVSEMTISACRVFGNWNEGIRIVSGNPTANLKIANTFIGGNSHELANKWDGIVMEPNVDYVMIEGNGCWGGAVGQSTTQRYGVSIGTGCDNFIVSDNICQPNLSGGILNNSGTAATRIVTGNVE